MAFKLSIKTFGEKYHHKGDRILAAIIVLIAIEFFWAAFSILSVDKDPKNAFLFGYSMQRIGLFIFAVFVASLLALLAINVYQSRNLGQGIHRLYSAHISTWQFTSYIFALIGLCFLICPASLFGVYSGFFERLRPLLTVAAFAPGQSLMRWLPYKRPELDKHFVKTLITVLIIMLGLIALVATTRLGITPEAYYWNVAGIPVTGLQVLVLLLVSSLAVGSVNIIGKHISKQYTASIDIAIIIILYLCTILIWGNAPMVKHFVSLQPRAPYFQPFPHADALGHDLGAISILKGWGINFGEYTDKPLYMVYLAVLHFFSGYDYNLIIQLQIYLLAFIPALLYNFGKLFQSRFFGLLISGLIVIRQYNAIILSHTVASANPRLLLTEVPTMLALILVTWLVFLWLKNQQGNPWIAIATGAALGVSSLIRLNPVILMPAILFFALFSMWKTKKKWSFQISLFIVSFILTILPWLTTGLNSQGQPYFFIKFIDVINTRYQPVGLNPTINLEITSKKIISNSPAQFISYASTSTQNRFYPIYTNHFPGFAFNHFFHNLIETFLSLPDSAAPEDQNLNVLTTRPYWLENGAWQGELKLSQIPFILANLIIVALGISWSWRQWHWSGLTPLLIFLVYLASLGLARNSGSRYLVPIDWIIVFYYALGLVLIVHFLQKSFDIKTLLTYSNPQARPTNNQIELRMPIILSLLFLGLVLLIPAANKLITSENILCANQISANVTQLAAVQSNTQVNFLKGEVLYPEVQGDGLKFVLLTCKRAIPLVIENFDNSIENGQLVFVGLATDPLNTHATIIISLKGNVPQTLWQLK